MIRTNERGATLVEFAVVAPLLFLLLFGVIEFGRAVATYTAVTTAAREAARFATTVGDGSSPAPYEDCDGIREAAFAKTPLLDRTQTLILIDYNGDAEGGVDNTCPVHGEAPIEVANGDRIIIEAQTTFTSPIPLISNILGELEISSIQQRTIYPGS